MPKQTLFFTNPYYLRTENKQLKFVCKDSGEEHTRPIEDLGYLILDHPQLSLSQRTMQHLMANRVAVIYCNDKHLPCSMSLPLDGHYLQGERFRRQITAGQVLKKQLWKQTIEAKIANQAQLLDRYGLPTVPMQRWQKQVLSGDTTNREALASRHYWTHLFTPHLTGFTRQRYGAPPNNLLNYGYAILRAAMARALVGAGLLCTLGIHHHNRYNAFCLADDMMEPYRPFVDYLVWEWIDNYGTPPAELTPGIKRTLLSIVTLDTVTPRGTSPLEVAVESTARRLADCFEGTHRKLRFATLPTP